MERHGGEGHKLSWQNVNRLDEGDVVQQHQFNSAIRFVELNDTT
jgi:hypothetical protein